MNTNNGVEKYLNSLPADERKILRAMRGQIQKLIPGAEERLSRGVPFFYYKGKRAVGFRSSKNHLSFFIMEGNVLKELQKDIAHLNYSSTVIRFNVANQIPEAILRKLVKARIQEIEHSLVKKI